MRRASRKFITALGRIIVVSFLVGAGPFFAPIVNAAQLQNRALQLSSSDAGEHHSTYNVSFEVATTGSVGSIEFKFCSNSTFISDPCTAPFGFDADNAILSSQSPSPGFAISPSSGVNDIVIERTATTLNAGPASFRFDHIVNPTNEGSYYLRVLTFPTNDATGSPTDSGGMAFAINSSVSVSTEVPPYIAFCTGTTITGTDCSTASGDFIDLGEFSPTKTSGGTTQLVAATNAQNGYNISVSGSTLTSGNNEITAMETAGTPKVGINQFGINLRANTNPAIGQNPIGPGSGAPTADYALPNIYRYHSGDAVAGSTTADDYRKYTVSYMVNVNKNQAPGIYASTFTYVALANF